MKLLCIQFLFTIAVVLAETFQNPVIWNDLADLDIIRVDDVFYMSTSTMHYSPGAPVLQSYDLVNWEYIGHSVPVLDWSSKYDLTNGEQAYVKGIWASSLNYRKSTSTFYWVGCIESGTSYIYTAQDAAGPWAKNSSIENCYYDAGLLIDPDTDAMYVAYGQGEIHVAQLSDDGFNEVKSESVFTVPSDFGGTLEGSRFYKINGNYYIFTTRPANGQYVLKSSDPFGPYELHEVLLDMPTPIDGGGVPHQGGLVEVQDGKWYYMAFVDSYPGGRVPVLAPITWDADGFPVVTTADGAWGKSYDYPLPKKVLQSPVGTDRFDGKTLDPRWEWNHNPDTSKFSLDSNGLHLSTVTVTDDLYAARNTITRRILGPISTATIRLDYSGMKTGDRAGLTLLRDKSAWIGIANDEGASPRIAMVSGIDMTTGDWSTASTGTEVANAPVPDDNGSIWLRATADIRPSGSKTVAFAYSTDGSSFTDLGDQFAMYDDWQFFLGYRFGIFNYATSELGGSVTVREFSLEEAE